MKHFKLIADIVFDAENIEQAAKKIAEHFNRIANQFADEEYDDSNDEAWFIGEIKLNPEDKP
jgi:hypothetical protein